MSKKYILPIALILALVASSCGKVQAPEFRSVERFRLKNLGLQEATLGFDVRYFNPNTFGLTVKETDLNVYVDTTYMGKFVQDRDIDVQNNSDFIIPLSGTIPLKKALQLNLKDIGNRDVLIRADGTVKAGKAGIFTTRPVHYEGKHRLDELKLF